MVRKYVTAVGITTSREKVTDLLSLIERLKRELGRKKSQSVPDRQSGQSVPICRRICPLSPKWPNRSTSRKNDRDSLGYSDPHYLLSENSHLSKEQIYLRMLTRQLSWGELTLSTTDNQVRNEPNSRHPHIFTTPNCPIHPSINPTTTKEACSTTESWRSPLEPVQCTLPSREQPSGEIPVQLFNRRYLSSDPNCRICSLYNVLSPIKEVVC